MRPTWAVIVTLVLASSLICGSSTGIAAVLPPTDLLSAIQKGDHRQLARLLKQGAAPNAPLPDGSLPLAWAVERQDAEAVRLLLKSRAKVNDSNPLGNAFTPLIVACLNPSEAILDQLLDKAEDVNVRGPEGIPALSLCAAHAPSQSVQRLLARGANVAAVDHKGQSALMWAAAHAQRETFDLLLTAGANINRRSKGGFTPVMFAVKSGSARMAKHVVAVGADTNVTAQDGTTLIQLAMYQGNYGFAQQLLEHPVDVHALDRNGRSLLHAAVIAKQPALVKLLLDAGADINQTTGESRVRWRYESNFRAGGYKFPQLPPLLLAAKNGDSGLMTMLANHGADTQVKDAKGNNVLHYAAKSSSASALGVALGLSNNPNVKNLQGETPLSSILAMKNDAVRKAMLQILATKKANTEQAATVVNDYAE